jgi:kynureninase
VVVPTTLTRADAAALDEQCPVAHRRSLFSLPDGVIHLTGNSLGALPRHVPAAVQQLIADQWGGDLISAWNTADWTHLSWRVAARIEPLVGAASGSVYVGESTSVTLFKTLVAALNLRPDRSVIVMEPTTFPTDGYIAQGIAASMGKELRWCDPADPAASLDDDVAVLALTHVDFRTGSMYDLHSVTSAAHAAGALMVWDLCHSVGAVPVDLAGCDADFAVGCTYKYLNGGPGSPAFGYAAPRLHDRLEQPITGWWGHAHPFTMQRDYEPGEGVVRMVSGTPPVVALGTLMASLDVFEGVSMADIRGGSLSRTTLFMELMDERFGDAFTLITPRDPARRGSQVSYRHPHAYGVVQALIRRKALPDFREPDVARFGFAPLYVTHADVYDTVDRLEAVIAAEEHLDPAYATKNAVT